MTLQNTANIKKDIKISLAVLVITIEFWSFVWHFIFKKIKQNKEKLWYCWQCCSVGKKLFDWCWWHNENCPNVAQITWSVIFAKISHYRPQRSCGKVIFSQASVSHSVHGGGGGVSQHALRQTLPGRHTPRQTPWAYTPLSRHCCGWYASYWNAILLKGSNLHQTHIHVCTCIRMRNHSDH